MIRKALRWLGLVERPPDVEPADEDPWSDYPAVRNQHGRELQTEEDESERGQP